MANPYDIGDVAKLSGSFTVSATGVAIDPTTVRLFVRDPAGGETIYVYGVDSALIKDSVGNYHRDLLLTQSGKWYYRFVGDGAAIAAGEKSLTVVESAFAVPL